MILPRSYSEECVCLTYELRDLDEHFAFSNRISIIRSTAQQDTNNHSEIPVLVSPELPRYQDLSWDLP